MAQAIVQSLCTKLRSAIAIEDEATGDLQEIMETLEAIQPLLQDADRQSFCFNNDDPEEGWKQMEAVWAWLRRVVKAAYDILDELQDTTMTTAAPARKMTKMIPRANTPEKKNLMADKMEKIKEEVCKLRVDMDEFNLTPSDSNASIEPPAIDVTEVEEHIILGREKQMHNIMESISVKEGHCITIQIGGQEGSGKTTLARMVFNHTRFKDYSRVWIQCSGDFHLYEIGKSIISQVSREEISGGSNDNMEYVRKRLHQLLDDGIESISKSLSIWGRLYVHIDNRL